MTEPDVPGSPDDAPATRQAATIILLRHTDGGPVPEVLLLRRHARSGFAASLWVFPGGVVDPSDALVDDANWVGIDAESLAGLFVLPAAQVLAMHVAGVRETFEEAGVLLARHRDGRLPDTTAQAFTAMREQLNDREGSADWPGFLRQQDLVLDLGALTLLSRWVTPIQEPRRYDTFFFVARMPDGATASADNIETTQDCWIGASAAIVDDDVPLIFPTIKNLTTIADLGSIDAVIAHAQALSTVPIIRPHIKFGDDGRFTGILLPDDEGFPHDVYADTDPAR